VLDLPLRRMSWALGLIIWKCGSREIQRIILSFWPFPVPSFDTTNRRQQLSFYADPDILGPIDLGKGD